MPPLPDDLAAVLQGGAAVTLVHEVCPGETEPEPEGRYFEVRVRIVEVTEVPSPIPNPEFPPSVTSEELASFVAGVRADDLEAAMRPLALALGERWLDVEKHARLADPKVEP